jgi:hypothetical protein
MCAFQRYRDILRTYKAGKELATSSLLFKKPYLDLIEADDARSKEQRVSSASREVNADPEDGDPDDDELDAVDDLEEHPCNINQQTAIARTATRIALYMMREELGDSVLGETQHAHDFFVVNSCKVYCKIKMPSTRDMSVVDSTVNSQGHFKVDANQSEVWSGNKCEVSQSQQSMEKCDNPVFSGQADYLTQGGVCSSKQQADAARRSPSDIISPTNQSIRNETMEAMDTDQCSQDKLETVRGNEADQGGQHVSDQSHTSESEVKHTDRDASPYKLFDTLLPLTHKEVMKVLEEVNS